MNVCLRVTWLIIPKSCKFSTWAYRLFKTSSTSLCERWPSWLAPLGIGITQTIAAITEVYQLGSCTETCLPRSLPGDYPGRAKHNLVFASSAWHYTDRSSWQRSAGIWDVPPHSITCFSPPGGHDFPSKNARKSNLQHWTGWYRQLFWGAAWLRPQHRSHHPLCSLSPFSFCTKVLLLLLPTHFPHISVILSFQYVQLHGITGQLRLEGMSKVQPPAQSRISWEIRPSFPGLDLSGSQKFLMEIAHPLCIWRATSLSHCLPVHTGKKGLKHRCLWQWLSLGSI